MARCDVCGTTILFGGIKENGRRFCGEACHNEGGFVRLADQIPPDIVAEYAMQLYQTDCPRCGGAGPVDVREAHYVWSALVMTSHYSRSQFSCRSCGTQQRLKAIVFCLLLGWWGFPWGVIFTPLQVFKNLKGFFSTDGVQPSAELEQFARMQLAADILESQAESAESETPQTAGSQWENA